MNLPRDDSEAALRRLIYGLLILTSAAVMVGRIVSVTSKRGETPLLSANDRSRWCTIRALVDEGTYVIDDVMFLRPDRRDPEWHTIDLVRHRGRDGTEHYYSSKPPLFPTLVAGKYWLLQKLTGVRIEKEPFYVVRLLLTTTNVVPLILYFVLLACLVEQMGQSTWGRVFVMASATWGTFLTTFAVTLNNHLPAAVCVLIAVYAVLPIVRGENPSWQSFFVAGLASAFTVANELPALSFFALIAVALLWKSPTKTLLAFVPAAGLVFAAFVLTNYAAHESWRPPYAHRGDGSLVAEMPSTALATLDSDPDALRNQLAAAGVEVSSQATAAKSPRPNHWMLWDPQTQTRLALVQTPGALEVRQWDHWYEYEDSYWLPERKRGVDLGEPSRAVYAFHTLLGHHGVFSLTPIWLLSVMGIVIWAARGDNTRRAFVAMVVLLTFVCLAFYIARPLHDRNYGGVSCGFRWMFWFTPLWLICLLPAADACSGRRFARCLAWAFLFVSIVSATYANLNPWSHPWIFDYWTFVKWIQY